MDTAEIVIGEVQCGCCSEVCSFLGKRISQARESPHHHSHGKVLSLDVTSADVLFIGFALMYFHYGFYYRAWRIFRFRAMLPIITVQFHKLCEVHICTKRMLNCIHVKSESVRCDLDAVSKPLREIANQSIRCGFGSFPNCEAWNQLRISINGSKHPLIAKLFRVIIADSLLLLKAECPDFITLNVSASEITHRAVHQTSATITSNRQQVQDRVTVYLGKPLNAPNAHSFHQQLHNRDGFIKRQAHVDQLRMRFCKGFTTLRAAEAQ